MTSMASQSTRSARTSNLLQRGLSKFSEMVTSMLMDDDEEGDEKFASSGNLARLSTSVTAVSKQSSCAQPTCRKAFSLLEASRTCLMCKKDFCRTCAAYRRRLSKNGYPDPLGELRHVCRSCLEAADAENYFTNRGKAYKSYRRICRENAKKVNDVIDGTIPTSSMESCKADARQVADRLAQSFHAASKSGWVAGLVSEVVIPDWQKSPRWHRTADHGSCEGCKASLGFLSRKINCRICGRVLCTDCTKQEILLYALEEGGAAWAINGREGGPTSKPRRFETLPICNECCTELQVVMVDRLFVQEDPGQARTSRGTEFMDGLIDLQKKLISLENAIEGCLPEYMYLVEFVDTTTRGCPAQPIPGHKESPTYALSKLQYELIHLFSQLAVSSQKLKVLQPCTETQNKLLHNVTSGIFHYYSENVFLFRLHKQRLAQHMSEESLLEMRGYINERSMTNVCILIHQLTSEGEGLVKGQHFSSLAWTLLKDVQDVSVQELKLSVEKQDPNSWQKHHEILISVGKDESLKRLNISPKETPLLPALWSYTFILKVLSPLCSCRKLLSTTTACVDFPKTKNALLEITTLFQMIHTHFLFLHLSYKGQQILNGMQYKPLISIVPMCIKVCEKELKPLMAPYSCWDRYSSEVEALRTWWVANPCAEPLEGGPTLNPYFGPLQFIAKELRKLSECCDGLDTCKGKKLDCPQTRTVLTAMSETMNILKRELVLCYALFGLKELAYEYTLLQKDYDIDSTVILPVMEVIIVCDEELKGLAGSSHWEEYCKEMKQSLNTCILYHRQIQLDGKLPHDKQRQTKTYCKYKMVSTSLVVVSDICSCLEILTTQEEFSNIKSNLTSACATMEGMKAVLRHDLDH